MKPDGTSTSSNHSSLRSSFEHKKNDVGSEMDSVSIMNAEREQVLGERMRSIVSSFRTRVTSVKNRLEQPPSPDDNILRFQLIEFHIQIIIIYTLYNKN